VLEDLATAIESLDIPVDGAAIMQALALRDQLDARIAEAVGAFDAAKLWDIDGSTSMTAWLRESGSLTQRAAKRMAVLGRRMRQLPVLATAYAGGSLSGGQVEAILANVDDSTVALFAEQEADVVPYLLPLTVAGTARAMAAWKERAKAEAELPEEPERSLHLSRTLDDATCSTVRSIPRVGRQWKRRCDWPVPMSPMMRESRPRYGPMPWSR
jgi:hypothetical protein